MQIYISSYRVFFISFCKSLTSHVSSQVCSYRVIFIMTWNQHHIINMSNKAFNINVKTRWPFFKSGNYKGTYGMPKKSEINYKYPVHLIVRFCLKIGHEILWNIIRQWILYYICEKLYFLYCVFIMR